IVPYCFVRVVNDLQQENVPREVIYAYPGMYHKIATVLTELATHPSRGGKEGMTEAKRGFMTQHLGFATRADRFEDARKLWNALGDRVAESTAESYNLRPKYDRSRVHAYLAHEKELLETRKL